VTVQPDKLEGPAPGFRAVRFNMDWITRPLFGILLAAIAIGVLFSGPGWFAALMALIAIPAAREWHRCVGAGAPYTREAALTAAAVALSEGVLLLSRSFWAGCAVVVAGAAGSFLLARGNGKHPLWQAFGAFYLGLPALALVSLRAFEAHGAQIVVGLFFIVWATDSGALIFGNLIGGPRLAPRISPAKTWAGTLGGSALAALVYALFVSFLGGTAGIAALFGFLFSITAHAGDLFESYVKRHFGLKDSGAMIPGHGGVLDRMDSTLAAGAALALLVFLFHLNPLFGVQA